MPEDTKPLTPIDSKTLNASVLSPNQQNIEQTEHTIPMISVIQVKTINFSLIDFNSSINKKNIKN